MTYALLCTTNRSALPSAHPKAKPHVVWDQLHLNAVGICTHSASRVGVTLSNVGGVPSAVQTVGVEVYVDTMDSPTCLHE
jgi:hypothetical protein